MNILLSCTCDNSGIYDKLITTQQVEFTTLLSVIIAIVGIFSAATYLYHKKISKQEIEAEVKHIFTREKESFLKEIKNEFATELSHVKGESARVFAFINESAIKDSNSSEYYTGLTNAVYWWSEALRHYISSNEKWAQRLSVESLLEALENVIKGNHSVQFYENYNSRYNLEDIFEILNRVDEILLKETDRIRKAIDDIKKVNESSKT